jgi:hypothetical protein
LGGKDIGILKEQISSLHSRSPWLTTFK